MERETNSAKVCACAHKPGKEHLEGKRRATAATRPGQRLAALPSSLAALPFLQGTPAARTRVRRSAALTQRTHGAP